MSDQDQNETLDLETRIEDLLEEIEATRQEPLVDLVIQDPPQLQEEEEKAENESDVSSTSSQGQSSMSSTSKVLTSIFGNATALDDTDIASSLSTHKKEDRAGMDAKTLQRVKDNATKVLDVKFKVQSALGTSGVKGEENPDIETSELAAVFAENTHVLEKVSRVVEEYDMISATQIRKVKHKNEVHPAKKYDENAFIDITKEIGTLTLDEVKEYSGDVMQYDVKDGTNRQNLAWLLMLVRNNVSSSIAALIDPAFDKQDIMYRNGAVYLKLVVDLCFSIDEHVIESLKDYITRFGKNGLTAFEGENVNMAAIEIVAIARRLDQLGKLPQDSPKDILKGLQRVTHNYNFKETFGLVAKLQGQTLISISSSTPSDPLELIIAYFDQAKSLYTSAVLRNQWAGKKTRYHANTVGSYAPICWNCGGNHSLKDCKEEKNQARIQKAKDAYYENKKKNGSGNYQPRGDSGTKSNGYSRSGFGKTTAANGVTITANGQVYTSCKHGTTAEGCGMNQTHSSKYHHQWKANKGTFTLPGAHPFMVALAANEQCLPAGVPSTPNQVNVNEAVSQALLQFKADTAKKLATIETQSDSPDVANAAGMLMKLFQ